MDRDEALRLLTGGEEGVREWNRRRAAVEEIPDFAGANLRQARLVKADLRGADLGEADLDGADLRGARLDGAHLDGARLVGARLDRADLGGADLTGADLDGADLGGADLIGACLIKAHLDGADLGAARLIKADLDGADLRGADLRGADLDGADLFEADLRRADLSGTNLRRARLIRCKLDDAIFDEADVTDCHVQETIGRPKPPRLLRFEDRPPVTGEDAGNFFTPPALVEVSLTEVLTDEDLGAFRFHLGDLRRQGVGIGVHLTGERVESGGTVLRFQAPTYAAIYDALPLVLKPFRMSRAVDWAKTYEALPEHDRGAVLTALAKVEAGDSEGRWPFVPRLAEVSERFFNAKILQLREGRNQGVLIEIASDQAVERRLAQQKKQISPRSRFRLTYENPSVPLPITAQGPIVGSALGAGNIVNARDITAFITSVGQADGLDPDLKRVLIAAREALASGDLTGPDKDDAADDLGKLADELTKPEPQPGRVKRLFERVKHLAPDVASLLSSTAKIGELIRG